MRGRPPFVHWPSGVWLLAFSGLTWAGLVGFIAATIRSISRPETAVGHAERFLVVTYTAWLVLAALSLAV